MVTNEELVTRMMRTSQAGALKQAFIIEAIHNYSQMVLQDTEVWSANSFINQDAWKQCAKECLTAIDERI
jgi:hypothetical protein